MKKNVVIKALLAIYAIVFPITMANAAGAVNPVFTCDGVTYSEEPAGAGIIGTYRMLFYDTKVNGSTVGMTYCLSPRRSHGTDSAYRCERKINPTETSQFQANDVAFVKAYQEMYKRNLTGSSAEGRLIGETVFRWLSYQFGAGDMGSSIKYAITWNSSGELVPKEQILARWNPTHPVWANTGDPQVETAKEIYELAHAAGSRIAGGETYDQLVADGTIWDIQADISDISATESSRYRTTSDGYEYVVLDVKLSGDQPKEMHWESTTVTCDNTWDCQIAEAKQNRIVVKVKSNSGTGSYGMTLHFSYFDARSATANMMIVWNGKEAWQKMLVVSNGAGIPVAQTSSNSSGGSRGGRSFKVEGCTCDVTTGTFTYTKSQKNQSPIKETCKASETGDKCASFKQKYNCSAPADNPNCEPKAGCRQENGKCYGPDGKEIPCNEYEDKCNYKCTDTYQNYCPGDGTTPNKDGKIKTSCSEAQWTKICLCEKEPNNPKCANCNPAVNMVGDCADLTTDKVESTYTGAISDVNEKDATGAYIAACRKEVDKDPIKACVANDLAIDATGKSFKSSNSCDETNSATLTNNPYCNVYCSEQYNFTTPTAQLVQSGGYFTVKTSISGKRTCYVAGSDNKGESISINRAQFDKDIAELNQKIVNEWNIYEYNRKAYEKTPDITQKTCTIRSRSCCGGRSHGHCNGGSCSGSTANWNYYEVKFDYLICDYSGKSCHWSSDSKSFGTPNNISKSCCSGSSCNYTDGYGPWTSQRAQWKLNMDTAAKNLKALLEEFKTKVTQYNSCTNNTTQELSSFGNGYTSVAKTWKNDLKYNPKVTFDYYENYPTTGNFVQSNKKENTATYYYNTDPGNDYDANNTKGVGLTYDDYGYMRCDDGNCTWTTMKIAKPLWMKIVASAQAEYNSPNSYSTFTPYGTIKQQSGDGNNWLELIGDSNGKPVPVETIRETGVYPFKFTYSNIGRQNDSCDNGRLVANAKVKSVLTEYNKLKDSEKCNAKGSNSKSTMTQEVGYVCHYITNSKDCPTCTFKCAEGKCEIIPPDPPVCDNDQCRFKCKNCVFSPSNGYTFRTVSLTNMFPNERTTETNWNDQDANSKARMTLEQIQSSKTNESGEEVYNTPQYSYTLTPQNMAKIREYNNKVKSYMNATMPNGDYVLNCDNNGDAVSVRCTSAFLDMLDRDKSYATVNKRITKDKDAFVLWNGKYGFDTGIGPAWRLKDGE